ncbi:MAG: putative transrane protein [Proteobacteria bacterium]|nr:putative transrane protein [Pseudomonadota bacterium]
MTSGNDRRFAALMLLGALALAAAASGSAAEGDGAGTGWGMKQLMADLARVKSSTARFTERKYMKVLSGPLELSGTLVYTAPDRLERNTLLPKPESMVVDRDTLTLESKGGQQRRTLALHDYPAIWAFVESIRGTLAGDRQSLDRFYRVTLEGKADRWRLLLTPTEPAMQALVSSIRIDGGGSRIDRIEIYEADGDYSVMTVNAETAR